MSASKEYVMHIIDLLSPLGQITAGRMFGGALLKHKGKQLGIIMGDALYFRVPQELQEKYRSRGSEPFRYSKKTGVVTVNAYWSVPDEVIEDKEALIAWAEEVLRFK